MAKRVLIGGVGLALAAGVGLSAGSLGAAQATDVASTVALQAPTDLPSGRTTYRTINDYNAEMLELADNNPDLVKRFKLPHKTRMGKNVYGIEVTPDVQADDGKPVMFVMGMHHGNEWPSGEHSLEFAYDLVNHYNGADPEITSLLDKSRVIVVPVVNVDGFIRNRRTSCGTSPDCLPANGVDVNRNYPFGWGANIASNFNTRGPGPGSEPEIQNIMDVTTANQVTTLVTNHTSGHTVLRAPFEKAAGDAPDEVAYKALSDLITGQNNYTGMQSGYDYETTGETNDWSYYATRGMGFTFEIMKTQSTIGTYPQVIEDYNGIGQYDGHANREAFMVVLRHTADASKHSQITGTAPAGAVLKVTKDFNLWTSPIKNLDTTVSAPQAVPTHLESTMTVPAGGTFTWDVNPSVRPKPGYTEAGVVATAPGEFLQESWTLTCSTPAGAVLDTVPVLVDLGEVKDVDLPNCVEYGKVAAAIGKVSHGSAHYGTSTPISIQVAPDSATGTVTISTGATTLGTGVVTNGAAEVSISALALKPGKHTLSLAYSGDAANRAASGTLVLNVARASARVAATVKTKNIRVKKTRAKLVATVRAAGVKATGRATVRVGGKVVGSAKVVNGRAVVRLATFRKTGKTKVVLRYVGSDLVAPAKVVIKVRVRK